MKEEGGKNLATVLIALKLLWKRKLTNTVIVVQLLLSIIMLAQVFVAIEDYRDNLRAVNELPVNDTIVLSAFDYYNPEYVTQQILSSPQVDSVGRVYMNDFVFCNNVLCNLAAYNKGIISHYSPELQSGFWLSDCPPADGSAIPAVVSGDMGLKIGDRTDVHLPDEETCRIAVVGILKRPTQYLFPSGGASPEYFSAKSVISQKPVIIVRYTDFGDSSTFVPPPYAPISTNVFVFLKSGAADTNIDAIRTEWGKYGEATPLISLVSTFNTNMNQMIGGTTIMFVVFLLLAVTGVLSNNVIQSLRNRRQFTVYYLLGMDWKKGAAVEACRVGILIIITMALSLVLGKVGLFMLEWMTPMQAYLFYGVVFLYIVAMFAAVGAGFLIKLMREDISGALKDLQQGE
jgi:hypothetical protein